jgi:hypothetical protein
VPAIHAPRPSAASTAFVQVWHGDLDAAEENLHGALALAERTPGAW